MKNLITLLLLVFTLSTVAQNQRIKNWFDFPDRTTLNSERTVKVQYNLFIDPLGIAPSGSGGRQVGFEAVVIMGGIYVAPSFSTFPQLENGYTDVVVSVGMTWHMFRTTAIRYYGGLQLGREWRPKAEFREGYEMIGMALGADLRLITFKNDTSLYIGREVNVLHRESQEDGRYGDSTGYDGGVIFKASTSKENGKIKLGFRF